MSTAVREQLADAAGGVEGFTAYPFYRQGTKAGHTFVRLERIEYPNRFGGIRHWNVVVVLPQDLEAAEKFLENKLPLLREALAPHLVIREVVPQRLEISGVGVLPCVFINGTREEE